MYKHFGNIGEKLNTFLSPDFTKRTARIAPTLFNFIIRIRNADTDTDPETWNRALVLDFTV